ncbi:MAG: DNA-3-methyladenine glycosylase 2 family protein [Pseudomonadota bacterium]
MSERIIETEADVAEGAAWLGRAEPRFGAVSARLGLPPLRRETPGFIALARAICSQQLSVASARAVWGRLQAAGADDPRTLAALDDDTLRGCGLSRPKIRYLRAIAAADLDYPALAAMPEPEAVATLTAIPGIGVWTAEVYLMFAIGRADVFAPGDLALQEGARMLFDLPERPSEKALRVQAEAWSPWRAVAARLLWAHYAEMKSRQGIME